MSVEPVRQALVSQLLEALETRSPIVLYGEYGLGQSATVDTAAASIPDWDYLKQCGNWLIKGPFAGFQDLIAQAIAWARANAPALLTTHQHSLKRLFPQVDLPEFTVPKDLTNTSSREERTRFYHHEYQIKLLHGLATFLIDYLAASRRRVLLSIDEAARMSCTSKRLLGTLARLDRKAEHLRFVLIDYDGEYFCPDAVELRFPRYSRADMAAAFSNDPAFTDDRLNRLFEASRGNMRLASALIECDRAGLPVVGYLDADATIDLFLSTKSHADRLKLLSTFLDSNCASRDPIALRNHRTLSDRLVDDAHAERHAACMVDYGAGRGDLVLIHAHSMRDPVRRLECLAEPSELLKCIGLYDTWFSYFAALYSNSDLRRHGTGDGPVNAVFINAAFVLYALGCAKASLPYLDGFYKQFPRSKFVPTVLYAQSMTYGRYQVPVNLPLAETYAMQNLDVIDAHFKDHEKYHYIKVFAENAYAYIKARQGKFDEALRLCLDGNNKMLEIYGADRFKLHQSILIYNTSQVYELTRKLALAEQQLLRAIAYDPYYGEYYNDLGNLLSKQPDRSAEALAAYDQAIALCPPYFEAFINRGLLYGRLGDRASAKCDFARAIAIKPTEWRAHYEIGNVHLQDGNYGDAIGAYRRASSYEPNNADLLSNLGLALSESGDAEGSIECYERAIAGNPRYAPAHNNLAVELFQLGRKQEALRLAETAVALSGDSEYVGTLEHIRLDLAAA